MLLSWKKYSTAIDIWSVGCILGEMMVRQPLFPGQEQEEQVQMIIDLVGYPGDEAMEMFTEMKDKQFIKNLASKKREPKFEMVFAGQNPDAIDLLKRMLAFEPSQRITLDEALAHPYLEQLHCDDDEPVSIPVSAFDFDFEIYDLKKEEYKDLIYEECMLYHSDEMLQAYTENKEKYPEGILSKRFSVERVKSKRMGAGGSNKNLMKAMVGVKVEGNK